MSEKDEILSILFVDFLTEGYKVPKVPIVQKMEQSWCPRDRSKIFLVSEGKSSTSFMPAYYICKVCKWIYKLPRERSR